MKRYHQLTQGDRYQIARLFSQGKSKSEIARHLEVHRSTIGREIKRNWSPEDIDGHSEYDPLIAQGIAESRRYYHGLDRRKIRGVLRQEIESKLRLKWSPEQIVNRLKIEGKASVSHEAIYQFVLRDKVYDGDLYKQLRRYRRRRHRFPREGRGKIANRRPMSERPARANSRTQIGHWERDLMIGVQRKSALLTMVDRKSRFTIARRLETKSPREVFQETEIAFRAHKKHFKSITNDNGLEFQDHEMVTAKLGVPVYFTRPYASWERGTNENTNGLLRQYFPKKKADFLHYSEKQIQKILNELNLRPRKCLGFRTPYEIQYKTKLSLCSPRLVAREN